MTRYFITNNRVVDGEAQPIEYSCGGNFTVLEPGQTKEVSFDEAQVALSRWQTAGLDLREAPDVETVPDPKPEAPAE